MITATAIKATIARPMIASIGTFDFAAAGGGAGLAGALGACA
jgi:hypothetical protein